MEPARAFLLVALLVAAAPTLEARVFLTVEDALELAFPGCELSKESRFLTEQERNRAERLADAELSSSLVVRQVARCGGDPGGTAYFDTHRVRTLPETLMVVVDVEGRIARVEVLSFREPEEYLPRKLWYEQVLGRELDLELQLKRGIRPVTGATLTARVTVDAVRRTLAIHGILEAER